MSIFASVYTSQKMQLDPWINMLGRHIATVHKVMRRAINAHQKAR